MFRCQRKRVRRNLREDGMDALAHLGGRHADVHPGLAVGKRGQLHPALGLELGFAIAGERRTVAEKGEANAVEFLLPLAQLALRGLPPLAREISALQRLLEAGGGAIFRGENLAGGGAVAGANMDLLAILMRGAAEVRRHGINVRFNAPDGLRRAEAAERAARHGMGARHLAADHHIVAAIGQRAMQNAAEHHHVGNGQVGPAVQNVIAFNRGERAIFFETGFVAHPHRMTLGREENVLVALISDFDRLAGFQRGQGRIADQHGGIFLLAAERAADGRLAHADFFRRELERVIQFVHREIGALQRAICEDGAVFLRINHHALVFQVKLFLMAGLVFALQNVVRLGKPLGDVALDDVLAFHRVKLVGRCLENGHGFGQRQERGQGVHLHADMCRGGAGLGQSFGGHHGHRFTAVAYFRADFRQQRHGAVVHVHHVFARDVLGRRHRDSGPVVGRIRLDRLENAARHRRTHHHAMQNPLERHVVKVAGLPANLAGRIHAVHAGSDQLAGILSCFGHHSLLRVNIPKNIKYLAP